MTVLTTETFKVGATVLNLYAYNFETFDGRMNGPAIRGTDLEGPRGADRYRPRWYGPKHETWSMIVLASDPATDIDGGRAQANANLHQLKRLFIGNPGVPLVLEKKVAVPGGLITLSASAALAEGDAFRVSTERGGEQHSLTIELLITAGYWSGNAGSASTPGTVTVGGTARVTPSLITLGGSATVTNITTNTGFVYVGPACTIDQIGRAHV